MRSNFNGRRITALQRHATIFTMKDSCLYMGYNVGAKMFSSKQHINLTHILQYCPWTLFSTITYIRGTISKSGRILSHFHKGLMESDEGLVKIWSWYSSLDDPTNGFVWVLWEMPCFCWKVLVMYCLYPWVMRVRVAGSEWHLDGTGLFITNSNLVTWMRRRTVFLFLDLTFHFKYEKDGKESDYDWWMDRRIYIGNEIISESN